MFLNIFKYILKLIFISILFLIILCVYIIIFKKKLSKNKQKQYKTTKTYYLKILCFLFLKTKN